MNTKNTSLILIPILLILGCASLSKYGKLEKSARKHYQQKNYDIAFNHCISSLRLKPQYDKAQLLMQDIFKKVVEYHQNKIENYTNSMERFKYDDIVSEYKILININNEINSLPQLIDKKTKEEIIFDTIDYSEEYLNAKRLAAESHYAEGDRLSKINTLDSQKAAAKQFGIAIKYVQNYKDSADRYEICRKAGIKRMAIIPFENKSGKVEYGAVEEMITDQIISTVMNDQDAMEFLEIISRDRLNQVMREQQLGLSGVIDQQTAIELGRILGVHELLTGRITQISYTAPRTASSNISERNEVVVGEETYYDKDGKKKRRAKWGEVTATVTKYVKTASSSINGSYSIIEVSTARIKKSESFKGIYSFNYDWGVYRGDERALSGSSRSLCSKTESFPPGADEMINRASRSFSQNLARTLIEYAR
jgi:hypothetical protein